MSSLITSPAPTPVPTDGTRLDRSRSWAAAGVVAALAGVASVTVVSGHLDAVYGGGTDPAVIVGRMAEQKFWLIGHHVANLVAALLLLVVAAGLTRRLRSRLPEGSLLPAVAASGLGLVSVAGLLGTGLTTELLFALMHPEVVVPAPLVFMGYWTGTIAWLWVGAGVTGVCLALAAFRHRAVPVWIGVVSLVLGGLTLLLGLSPLQYMAGMTGPVWLLVVSLGFLLADGRRR
ncbi:hypothetical protein ACFFKU_03005 [Kineococcus gynurae]|uniref:DUF4386 family protein n=1 Tax=Kineococcus gynurae TaxID=452979 RepID=A0ABV5LS82_9ACTN